MKILFIFTGGTIGSTLKDGNVIATDEKKSYKIIEAYGKKYTIDFEYDVCEPYTELSENNTGEHIRMLSTCIRSKLDCGYDGIIITHGTDTLQYSAAMHRMNDPVSNLKHNTPHIPVSQFPTNIL